MLSEKSKLSINRGVSDLSSVKSCFKRPCCNAQEYEVHWHFLIIYFLLRFSTSYVLLLLYLILSSLLEHLVAYILGVLSASLNIKVEVVFKLNIWNMDFKMEVFD